MDLDDFYFALKCTAIFCASIMLFSAWSLTYFKRKKIPYLEPTILFGNVTEVFTHSRPGFEIFTDFYKTMRSKGHKHAGFYAFGKPLYVVLDLEYVKNVLMKDFQYFNSHGHEFDEKHEPLGSNLFTMGSEQWKNLRPKITPAFSMVKLKLISPTVIDCAVPLKQEIARLCDANLPMDVYDLAAKFSIDVVGSCFFGIDCNSFKYPDAEFKRYAENVFTLGPVSIMKSILVYCWPKVAFALGMKIIKKEATDFFVSTVKNTVQYRQNNNLRRNDVLQTFIDMRGNDESMSYIGIASQSFMLFVAGHETASLAVTHCMFELAKNQVIQDKMRNEIRTVLKKYGGEINFEGLAEMKYVEQALNESLRKYPPVSLLIRKCLKDYEVPGTGAIVDKGTQVIIPIHGIQNDPEYYPQPELFDPDRFVDNKRDILPFTFLPFGDGPRICMAIRMAMMQMKTVVASFLGEYRIHLHPDGPQEISFDPFSIVLRSKETILLKAVKIDNLGE